MKQIIFFFALLCSISAFGQRNVLSDTTFTTNSAGKFFENRAIVYDNGESSTAVTLIGDTAAVKNLYLNAANVEGRQMGAAIALVIKRVQSQATVLRISKTAKTSTGQDIPTITQKAKQGQWLNETLSFTNATNTRSATVTTAVDGTLRLNIGTDAARIMQLIGDAIIRVQGYPSGASILYLYNIGDNKTFSDFSGANFLTRTTSLQ